MQSSPVAPPMLTMRATQPDGSSLVYSWALQTKPAASHATNDDIANRAAEITTFYPDIAGDYTVSLAVYDGKSWSTPDVMAIHAIERIANTPPIVYAGADVSLDAGTAECENGMYGYSCDSCPPYSALIGEDATITDDESDPYTTLWELVSGVAEIDDPLALVTMVTLESAEPEEPGDCSEATATFRLNATDCPMATASDEVTLTVICCGVKAP